MDSTLLTGLLCGLVSRYAVPGAQCALYTDGRVITAQAGTEVAGAGPVRAVTAGSRFPFASVTKLFTATLVMQLVSDGDIDLDEAIQSYGGEFDAAPEGVTVRRLLSHTAGLVCDHAEAGHSVAAHAKATCGMFELVIPGTAFSYSNAGYVLLGRLVEVVTGMSWSDAVESFLLRPLGMATDPAPVVPGHAGANVPIEAAIPPGLGPAAGLAGSAADLVAFGRLHLGGPLLDSATAAEMRRPASDLAPFGLADAWGLGWGLFGPDGWLGLDAAGAGTTCNLRVHPSGTVVALTTNSVNGLAVWRDLVEALRADGLPVVGAPISLAAIPGAPRPFAERVGTWVNGEMTYSISAGGTLTDDDGTTYQLTEYEHRIFAASPTEQPDARYWGRFLDEDAELMQFAGRVLGKQTDVGAGT